MGEIRDFPKEVMVVRSWPHIVVSTAGSLSKPQRTRKRSKCVTRSLSEMWRTGG